MEAAESLLSILNSLSRQDCISCISFQGLYFCQSIFSETHDHLVLISGVLYPTCIEVMQRISAILLIMHFISSSHNTQNSSFQINIIHLSKDDGRGGHEAISITWYTPFIFPYDLNPRRMGKSVDLPQVLNGSQNLKDCFIKSANVHSRISVRDDCNTVQGTAKIFISDGSHSLLNLAWYWKFYRSMWEMKQIKHTQSISSLHLLHMIWHYMNHLFCRNGSRSFIQIFCHNLYSVFKQTCGIFRHAN